MLAFHAVQIRPMSGFLENSSPYDSHLVEVNLLHQTIIMYRIAKAYFVGRLFLLPQLQPAKYIS